MDFTTTKLPRVGSKAYQQQKAAERAAKLKQDEQALKHCLLYTSPSPRDMRRSRMPSSA